MENQSVQENLNRPSPPTEPVKKKPLKFGLSIAVVIICLVATGVAVYWIKTEPVETATNVNIQKPHDEIAGWQTYRNEEYGFEVKYPDNLKLFFSSDSDFMISQDEQGMHRYFLLSVFENKDNLTIDKYIETEIPKMHGPYSATTTQIVKIEDYQNDNISGKKVTTEYNNLPSWIIILSNGKFIYRIFPPIDENILNTFKFIEPIDTSNWQIYRNEEDGFEIKYPLNFEYISGEGQINFRQKGTTKSTISYFTFSSLDNSVEKILSSDDNIVSKEPKSFGDVKNGIFYTKKWSNGNSQDGYILNHNNKIYSFWNEDAASKNLFLQILSTFKFIK